jgi:hypothetical protein
MVAITVPAGDGVGLGVDVAVGVGVGVGVSVGVGVGVEHGGSTPSPGSQVAVGVGVGVTHGSKIPRRVTPHEGVGVGVAGVVGVGFTTGLTEVITTSARRADAAVPSVAGTRPAFAVILAETPRFVKNAMTTLARALDKLWSFAAEPDF